MPEMADMTMTVAFEAMRSASDAAPADELAAGWTLIGRATLQPDIPDARPIYALVFRAPEGEMYAGFLDKTTYQFRRWPVTSADLERA